MLKRRIRKTKSGSWHWECYICTHWGYQWTWAECLDALQRHDEERCGRKRTAILDEIFTADADLLDRLGDNE